MLSSALPALPPLSLSALPLIAVTAMTLGALVLVATMLSRVTRPKISRQRLRPEPAPARESPFAQAQEQARTLLNRALTGRTGRLERSLDIAGFRISAPEFLARVGLVTVALVVALVIALGPGGLVLGLLAGLGGGYLVVQSGISRARRRFADQLDENLQVLAGSLRAGYSLMQAMGSLAAADGVAPSRDEFARVINQTRLGRPLGEALAETATRMDSQDFTWAAEAIAINREVGGNLANVLDGVSHTIRERGALRRQVKALAAEGKLSAIILAGLPVLVALVVGTMNPQYFVLFFTTGVWGYGLLLLAVVMMTLGIVTLRAVIRIKY